MRYAVVIEKGENNDSAYVPDLPGCVSVVDTRDEVEAEIHGVVLACCDTEMSHAGKRRRTKHFG